MWPFGTGLFHQGQISRGSSRLCVYQYYFPFYHWMYHSCSISNLFKSVWGCFSLGLLPIQLLWTPEYRLSESVQFSSVAQLCPTLGNAMNRSTPGLPVHHQLPEFTQTHVHWVSDAIQPFHPLSSPSPPAPNPSQHQSLFQWVNSSHEVAKVLEFQL